MATSQNRQKKSSSPHKKEKRFGWFYRIHLFIFLLVLIVLSYFVILVSTEPKSFPFVTHKIEEVLQEKIGDEVAVSSSYISFTRYGTLKIAINSLTILYKAPNSEEKQAFIIPRVETEFSLFNLMLLRFQPSKIKIINSEIVIDDIATLQTKSDEELLEEPSQAALIIKLLSAIRKGEVPIKNFEIENAKLFIRGENERKEILIKKAKITTSISGKLLNISSVNTVNFDPKKVDVDLNSNCQLSKQDGLKCDVALINFVPSSICDMHPYLAPLGNITAILNASASFTIKEGQMNGLVFAAQTNRGDFEFPDFFSQKMRFTDFAVKGEYDHVMGVLNLSSIEGDFVSEKVVRDGQPFKSHFNMSLMISDLQNPDSKKLDFNIALKNVLNDEMEKFWPSSLSDHGIRDWVIAHIKGGLVTDAFAKFQLVRDAQGNHMQSMDSEVNFTGFNLEYGADFPPITNVAGKARFTKQGMKINLNSGVVLGSKISDGLVAIDDFSAPATILKISGKSQGNAADGLKHVDYKSEFASGIEKYLNGNSQNDFDIRIPLHNKEILLKDTYIAVNSTVIGLNTDYVKGGAIITCKKDFGSTNFITNIDFTPAELTAKEFDVEKNTNIESGLDLIVGVKDPKKIRIRNIVLWKKEEVEEKPAVKTYKNKNVSVQVASKVPVKTKTVISKITADMAFETAPFLVTSLSVKNENFGNSSYVFSYSADRKSSSQKISLKAKQFNLGPLLEKKLLPPSGKGESIERTQLQVVAGNVLLMRGKSIRNLSLSLNCTPVTCHRISARGNFGRKQFLNFTTSRQDNANVIDGRITDVGYLAEGLGIANTISGGDAKIKMQNKTIEKRRVLAGVVTINNNITIYESATVKRLAKNDLFSKIRDKIFSSEKTTFDSVKIEFGYSLGRLDLYSLIANNYKIGITAKGVIDLKNNSYEIKGMIVPGFIINNLFGIGNIPILGNVISGLLTGGEGGGLFGIRYEYVKKKGQKEPTFETYKVSAFVPTTIKNLFD